MMITPGATRGLGIGIAKELRRSSTITVAKPIEIDDRMVKESWQKKKALLRWSPFPAPTNQSKSRIPTPESAF